MGAFICLKVISNLSDWIAVIKYIMKNSSETFHTTPQMRLQRQSWNLLILFSCISSTTICYCSAQKQKVQRKLHFKPLTWMKIPFILKVFLHKHFFSVFPSWSIGTIILKIKPIRYYFVKGLNKNLLNLEWYLRKHLSSNTITIKNMKSRSFCKYKFVCTCKSN